MKAYTDMWKQYFKFDLCDKLLKLVEELYYVYEANRCYVDLKVLKKDSPWYINSIKYIDDCLKKIYQIIDQN